jgi:DNA-binding XRE family transcriptional regulator
LIANDLEYQTTRDALQRLEAGLSHAGDHEAEREPLLQRAMGDAVRGEIEILRRQMETYEALRDGRVSKTSFGSLAGVADALIAARIAAGWSERDLAERLGLKRQVIERYEATRYQTATFARLVETAAALGVEFGGHARFRQATGAPDRQAAVG